MNATIGVECPQCHVVSYPKDVVALSEVEAMRAQSLAAHDRAEEAERKLKDAERRAVDAHKAEIRLHESIDSVNRLAAQLREQLDAAKYGLSQMADNRQLMLPLMQKLEYVHGRCPTCNGAGQLAPADPRVGHNPGCELATALAKLGKPVRWVNER